MKALLIVCAYNEGSKLRDTAERIQTAIESKKIRSAEVEVLIVDDGSSDGIPEEVSKKYSFHFIRNEPRKGVGYSIREAYRFGLSHLFDFLATMAGNNKDNPEELDRILGPLAEGKADFVQGSRYLPGGAYGNMPLYRRISTQFLHPWLFSLVSGKKITDSTNGFRAFRSTLLQDPGIRLEQEWLDHYELEPYLFCQSIRLGYRVLEAPVSKIYPDHKLGYTKIKPITGWWSILRPLVYLFFKMRK